jgi:choline-sulfatase
MRELGWGAAALPPYPIPRSALLWVCGGLTLLGMLWPQLAFGQATDRPQRPHILMIAIDDLNDWVGCLGGHPQVQTPNIDRLAAAGTLFTNAHCQSPLCNPSRTSVLTGLRPSTTGIYGLSPWIRQVPELAELKTLPQALSELGYACRSAGKIFHADYGRRPSDTEFHLLGPASHHRPVPPQPLVTTPGGHPLVDWGLFPHRDQDKADWQVADWAIDQIGQLSGEQPVFLSVGFFLPHVPLYATERWFDLYPEESLLLPPVPTRDRQSTPRSSWYLHWQLPEPRLDYLLESHQWSNIVRSYLACTSFMDSQVGRVLDALERSGQADSTVVVLWSDHGFHLGEKRITGKNTLWDRSTRVPMIWAGPGVAAGARCHEPVELLDIFPTLLSLTGEGPVENLEGHSLVPQLQMANQPRPWPAITTHNQGNHAIRTRQWRYIRYADGAEELYNMRADPWELDNLLVTDSEPIPEGLLDGLRGWLPVIDVPPAAGSAHRILVYDSGQPVWEGKPIPPGAPIPD